MKQEGQLGTPARTRQTTGLHQRGAQKHSRKVGFSEGNEKLQNSLISMENSPANKGLSKKESASLAPQNEHVSNSHATITHNAHQSSMSCSSQAPNSFNEDPVEMTLENFDRYLSSLDEMLVRSLPRPPKSGSKSSQDEEISKAREQLSSILATGLPTLFAPEKFAEILALSSKLQNDPNLDPHELSVLKLIQEVPLASKFYQDVKQDTAQANKFFADLEANRAYINTLKDKYNLSKEKSAILQAERATVITTMHEIEDQINILRSRKAALAQVVAQNDRKISELAAVQREVYECVPKIVHEVQLANSERPEWELRQNKAVEQEAEILAKFAPLEGFSFMK